MPWTQKEYEEFWEFEAKMEKAIMGGAFRTAIEKGVDEGIREAESNSAIRGALKKPSFFYRVKNFFNDIRFTWR